MRVIPRVRAGLAQHTGKNYPAADLALRWTRRLWGCPLLGTCPEQLRATITRLPFNAYLTNHGQPRILIPVLVSYALWNFLSA